MFAWIRALFKPKEIEVIDKIDLSHVVTPIDKPNDVTYKFPDPTLFKPNKVTYKAKTAKRKTTAKK